MTNKKRLKLPKIKTLIKILIPSFLLISGILTLLFLPFLNLERAIGEDTSQYTEVGYLIHNYNPIKPEISTLYKVEDGYLVTREEMLRTGINKFSRTGELDGAILDTQDFNYFQTKVEADNLEEAKDQVREGGENNSDDELTETEKIIREEIENDVPLECQQLVYSSSDVQLEDYLFIYPGITRREVDTQVENEGMLKLGKTQYGKFTYAMYIDSPTVIALNLIYEKNPFANVDTKLFGAYVVEEGCQIFDYFEYMRNLGYDIDESFESSVPDMDIPLDI